MSYCRWVGDSDVYCYADTFGGYTTHVAGNRLVEPIAMPEMPEDMSEEDAEKFADEMNEYTQKSIDGERKSIDLPFCGESFNDPTLQDFLNRITELRKVGYNVPEGVFERIKQEMKNE